MWWLLSLRDFDAMRFLRFKNFRGELKRESRERKKNRQQMKVDAFESSRIDIRIVHRGGALESHTSFQVISFLFLFRAPFDIIARHQRQRCCRVILQKLAISHNYFVILR